MINIIYSALAVVLALLFATGISQFAGEDACRLVWILFFLIFGIQWLAFILANYLRTEKFYDITGTLTYLLAVWSAVYYTGKDSPVGFLVASLVSIWSLRLGSYLLLRILKDGEDKRFREIKVKPTSFFLTWTLQGLWVFLTLTAAQVFYVSPIETKADSPFVFIGLAVWVLGFLLEVVSDKQKKVFRADPKNRGKFISSGLWKYSRHPNYVGEITLWLGITIIAFPSFSGWGYLGLISPIFVYWLLSRVSGVPLLEESAMRRWGEDPKYKVYVDNTPVLFPWS